MSKLKAWPLGSEKAYLAISPTPTLARLENTCVRGLVFLPRTYQKGCLEKLVIHHGIILPPYEQELLSGCKRKGSKFSCASGAGGFRIRRGK